MQETRDVIVELERALPDLSATPAWMARLERDPEYAKAFAAAMGSEP